MLYIPFDPDTLPATMEVRISGVTYRITLSYNAVEDFFTVDIADQNDNSLLRGHKIVMGSNVFDSIPPGRVPPGAVMVALDLTGHSEEANREAFLGACRLYISE